MNKLILIDPESEHVILRPKNVSSGDIQVFFDDVVEAVVTQIQQASAIFGCIAWLTNETILQALAGRHVSIIVQKEDFLRPDYLPTQALRNYYNKLSCSLTFRDIAGGAQESHVVFQRIVHYLVASGHTSLEAIRCLGVRRDKQVENKPILNHKFIVLCDLETRQIENAELQVPRPYAAWTGSFNFTSQAKNSLENGLLIGDREIAQGYMNEFFYLYPFSEQLN